MRHSIARMLGAAGLAAAVGCAAKPPASPKSTFRRVVVNLARSDHNPYGTPKDPNGPQKDDGVCRALCKGTYEVGREDVTCRTAEVLGSLKGHVPLTHVVVCRIETPVRAP